MQKRLGKMEKEAELGSAKAHHEEVRVVPGDETSSKVDKSRVRARDEDVSGCDSITAIWA